MKGCFVRLFIFSTLLGFSLSMPAARAQHLLDKLVTDERVAAAIRIALQNIDKGLCGAKKCSPPTPEEFAAPPVSLDQARVAMKAGLASGLMVWCGLDWQHGSFEPMMAYHRKILHMTDRQLAIVAFLHGMQQGMIEQSTSSMECSAEQRSMLKQQMPERAH